MTEDPTRATARPADRPAYGSVGPADPHADPATTPGLRAPGVPAQEASTLPTGEQPTEAIRSAPAPEGPTVPVPGGRPPTAPGRHERTVSHTRTSGLWTGLILSALVLLFLLIFILQNNVPVRITFLGLTGTLPTGVALLLAAIAGLLLVAIPGGLRMLQLRRAARTPRRTR